MHEALEGAPLAIASGITPENVGDFLPYASAFLVATGISRNFHDLDPRRVARLVGVVRAHDGASRGLTRSSYGQGEGTRSGHPVVLIDLTWGPVFEIDLSHFSEQVFAYRCDDPPRVDALEGLEQVGTVEIDGRPAILLRVPADFAGDRHARVISDPPAFPEDQAPRLRTVRRFRSTRPRWNRAPECRCDCVRLRSVVPVHRGAAPDRILRPEPTD